MIDFSKLDFFVNFFGGGGRGGGVIYMVLQNKVGMGGGTFF